MKKREVRRRKRAFHNVGGWARRQQSKGRGKRSGKRNRGRAVGLS